MSKNNQAQDRYNPPSNLDEDYEQINFGELNVGELIWLKTDKTDANHAHRKINEGQAMDTKTRETYNFDRNSKVYYKI